MPPLLQKLVEEYGVSGSEAPVRKMIEGELKNHVDKLYADKLGNLIAVHEGGKPKAMLAAHMDEIGLIVKNIDVSGRVYFYTVGSIEPVYLLGDRTHVLGRPELRGIISTLEMTDGREIEKLPKLENMFIDMGLTKEQLKKKGVDVGTFIVLEQEFGYLANQEFIYGKGLDDRIGCYILSEVARLSKAAKVKEMVNFVFTVQEEIGLYGAKTSAYELSPDWGIVVDVSSTSEENSLRLPGSGPTITIMDSATIGNRCMNEHIENIARKKKIPLQMDVSDVGTTDALSISISKGGVPATAIGVPVKNLHTTVGIASLDDIQNSIKLILEVLKNPPKHCLK
ncbi:MAG: M28 family peptidase [Candidatus Aenigmarchaeota archaeon]|nr:M28 family peptidase [Candidatus Aenigmarchaeota archaeon]